MAKRIPSETAAEIRRRYDNGETQRALKQEFGISDGTMSRLCGAFYKRNLPPPSNKPGTAIVLAPAQKVAAPVWSQEIGRDVETWATISGATALVSSHGRVFNAAQHRILKPGPIDGYPSVVLTSSADKRRFSSLVHRLVAAAFVPNPEPGLLDQVNHIDSVRTNSFYKNLEWVTGQGNTDHAEQHSPFWAPRVGSGRFNAKLTEADVVEIRKLYKAGVGPTTIAAKFGVHQSNVSNIVAGRSWRHVPDETTS